MPDQYNNPVNGDRVRWISKSVHPACYGIIGTWRIDESVMKVILPPQAKKLDPTMGPNWGTIPNHWWEYVKEPETNEWGEVSP